MKVHIEHRNSGFSSPIYHPGPEPWRGRVFCTISRLGAKPIHKIRIPANHPTGDEERDLLKGGLEDLCAYWQRVADEAKDGVYIAITYPTR